MLLQKIKFKQFIQKFVFYYSWLSFISSLYLVVEAFRKLDATRANAISWWDNILTYGFLIFLALLENFCIALVVAGIENILGKRAAQTFRVVTRSLIIAAFIVAWGYLLYWTISHNIPSFLKTFATNWGIVICLIITALLIWWLKQAIFTWVEDNTAQLKIFSAGITIVSIVLSAILLVEPSLNSTGYTVVRKENLGKAPNILLIDVDALTANDMALYGYKLPTTPNLDELAKTWTVYNRAYSVATSSVTNLPIVMTGRYPYLRQYYRYGDLVNLNSGWLDMSRILKSAGYETYWQGINTPGYFHLGSGIDYTICDEGFLAYIGRTRYQYRATPEQFFYPFFLNETGLPEEQRSNACNSFDLQGFQNLISGSTIKNNKPFFIFAHYPGVHGVPYISGSFLGTFLPLSEGLVSKKDQNKYYGGYDEAAQPEVDKLRLRYDEAILYADAQLAKTIVDLKKAELYDNTLIIISADHGENFNNLYSSHGTPILSDAELHVPLIIKYPFQTVGKRVDRLVSSQVDLFPTIMETAAIPYNTKWVDGKSLADGNDSPDDNRVVYARKNTFDINQEDTISVMQGDMKIISREGTLSIYNLKLDPGEKNNLLVPQPTVGKCVEQKYKTSMDSKFFPMMNYFCRYVNRTNYIRSEGTILNAPGFK